jgi:DNA-binding beta-propeller fold protein YncE
VGENIDVWDVTTNTLTPLVTSIGGTGQSGEIDSLMFVNPTTIVYSIIGGNAMGIFTCSAFAANGTCSGTETNNFLNVNPNNLNQPADLVADPSGTSFLVSSSANNSVYRINIATGAETLLADFGMRPDGLAYDGAGDLFVVLNESEIAQVNPTTGAIIKTLALPLPQGAQSPQADGLTYDSTTGYLYVASDDGGVYQVNTALTSQTYTQILTPANTITTEFDGIASAGNTLYIVNRDQHGVQYLLGAGGSVATGSLAEISPFDSGADDIAPATFGSLVSSPEPGSFLLIALGMIGIGIAGRRISGFSAR